MALVCALMPSFWIWQPAALAQDIEQTAARGQVSGQAEKPAASLPELRIAEPVDLSVIGSRTVVFRWSMASGAAPDAIQLMVKTTPNLEQGGVEKLNVRVPGDARSYTHTFDGDYAALYWSVRGAVGTAYGSWAAANGHVPRLTVTTQPGPATGWQARYYDNHSCTRPGCPATPRCQESLGAALDREWGAGAPCAMAGDNWGALFTSDFYFSEGDYVIHVVHDDGAWLWLDGESIGQWSAAGDDYVCPPRRLSGNHRLELVYHENSGNARLHLDWTNDTGLCAPSRLDNVGPIAGLISPSPGLTYTARPQVTVTVDARDAGTGVDHVDFFYSTSGGSPHQFAALRSPTQGSQYQVEFVDSYAAYDGQVYRFDAIAYDSAGNATTTGAKEVRLDTTPPALSFVAPVPGAGPQEPHYLASHALAIQVNAADAGSGLDRVVFEARYAGSGGWMEIGSDQTPDDGWRLDWQIPVQAANSPLALRARAIDRAGHVTEATVGDLFPDWGAPGSLVSSMGAAVVDQPDFPVAWQGGDDGSGVASYRVEARDGVGGTWSAWYEGPGTNGVFHGQIGHTYYFRSQAADLVGNQEPAHSEPDAEVAVATDSHPPVGSVQINGGARYSAGRDVTLDLAATDGDGVAQVRLAGYAAWRDAWDWIGPAPYAASIVYTLPPGQGFHTAFARFSDTAGNTSAWASAGVIFDSVAPACELHQPQTARQSVFDVDWSCLDDYQGVAGPQQEYRLHDVPGAAWDVFVRWPYAYVGARSAGLRILDVGNPTAPTEVGFVGLADVYDVYVDGEYAYVANGSQGFVIVNVADPLHPAVTGTISTTGILRGVKVRDGLAYLAAGQEGLLLASIADPAAPAIAGSYAAPGANYWDVDLAAAHAYVADYPIDGGPGGLAVVDIADSAHPKAAGYYDSPGYPESVAVSGTVAFLVDWSTLQALDVSQPTAPRLLGTYFPQGWIHDVSLYGTLALLPEEGSGLAVLKASQPGSPKLLGRADTPGVAYGVTADDAAGAGPLAVVADMEGGVQAVHLGDGSSPHLLNGAASTVVAYDLETQEVGTGTWQAWLSGTSEDHASFSSENGKSYRFRVRAHDRAGNVGEYVEMPLTTTVRAPDVAVTGFYVDDNRFGDSYGNGDGAANPGEFVEVQLDLKNAGFGRAQHLRASVSTADSCVLNDGTTLYDEDLWFADLEAGSSERGNGYQGDDLELGIAGNCPSGHKIELSVNIYEDMPGGNSWPKVVSIPVVGTDTTPPQFQHTALSRKQLNPGETLAIRAFVREGLEPAADQVTARIAAMGHATVPLPLYDDGQHGDGQAGDHWYSGNWTAGAGGYSVTFVAKDSLGNSGTADYPLHFTTQPFILQHRLLLVYDRLDGTYAGPEFHAFYTAALDALGYGYDLWDTSVRGPLPGQIAGQYAGGAIIWAMPEEGYLGDLPEQQAVLSDYLDGGGRLFVSAQDLGYYLTEDGSRPNTFLASYLHAAYVQDNVGLFGLQGVAGDPIGDGATLSIAGGDGAGDQDFPSEIDAISPAVPVFRYVPGSGAGTAPATGAPVERPDAGGHRRRPGVATPGEAQGSGIGALRADTGVYRAVYFAFGFEGIDEQTGTGRTAVMARVLNWLLPNREPMPCALPYPPVGVHEPGPGPSEAVLWWSGSDPDGDPLRYDVYLGKSAALGPSDLVGGNLANAWFVPRPLQAGQLYYWRVDARDAQGLVATGPVWSFRTARPSTFVPLVSKK